MRIFAAVVTMLFLFVMVCGLARAGEDCVTVVKVYTMRGCVPCHKLAATMQRDGARIIERKVSAQPEGIKEFPTVVYLARSGRRKMDQGEIYSRGCVGFLDPVQVIEWTPP